MSIDNRIFMNNVKYKIQDQSMTKILLAYGIFFTIFDFYNTALDYDFEQLNRNLEKAYVLKLYINRFINGLFISKTVIITLLRGGIREDWTEQRQYNTL